ncbi:YrhB domain-containing protein [Ideonella sp.]|uniref:YrhB domain-containing protein n=1 Tax=Ideonella sp. TaxID=1929293 RepID=UPI0035B0D30C
MVTFVQARKIAEAWVDIVTNGGAAIDRERTKVKPYGWLFCWNSKKYLADRSQEEEALVGNVPIFVDRVNGEVFCAGPMSIDWFVEYEKTIPPARLSMRPEQPNWEAE